MGNGFVQVPPQSTGKQVDGASLSVAGQTVIRQRVVIADNASSAGYAAVVGSSLQVRLDGSGTAIVAGTVGITGTAVVAGAVTVAGTVTVAGVVTLGAGAANIGTVNGISATVGAVITGFRDGNGTTVNPADSVNAALRVNVVAGAVNVSAMPAVNISAMPNVVLGAGAANIGFINGISSTVNVAGTFTIGTINNISATVVVAGTVAISGTVPVSGTIDKISAAVVLAAGAANIGFINGVSATVNVAGTVAISGAVPISGSVQLAAGAANIGFINGISAPVAISGALRVYKGPLAIASASHGPKCVNVSSSAGVSLIAAPGPGVSIYIDSILVTNSSATGARFDAYEASASATSQIAGYAAASGGGFNTQFDPPIKLSANTALSGKVKPNVSDLILTINFHVE